MINLLGATKVENHAAEAQFVDECNAIIKRLIQDVYNRPRLHNDGSDAPLKITAEELKKLRLFFWIEKMLRPNMCRVEPEEFEREPRFMGLPLEIADI